MISGENTQDEKGHIQDTGLMQHHAEERILLLTGVKKKRPLAQVTEDKHYKHKAPGLDDRLAPEMAHVGVQGLTACRAQNHFREHEKSGEAVVIQKPRGIIGINRLPYDRGLDHRHYTVKPDSQKPEKHDRSEQDSHFLGAFSLKGEEEYRDSRRDQNKDGLPDVLKTGDQEHTLNGTQHGDCRCNNAIPYEQRNPHEGEYSDEDHGPGLLE